MPSPELEPIVDEEAAGEAATAKMKSHSLAPVSCYWGEPPLSVYIAPALILGLMLSMIWVVFNERHKRRAGKRF